MQSSSDTQPLPTAACLQPFTCPLHPSPLDRSSVNMRSVPHSARPRILRHHHIYLLPPARRKTCLNSLYSRWSPRAVKWALAFNPASSHHLLFGSRGLMAMHQGWNTYCGVCMRGESAGEPLLKCKAGLLPLDQMLVKR